LKTEASTSEVRRMGKTARDYKVTGIGKNRVIEETTGNSTTKSTYRKTSNGARSAMQLQLNKKRYKYRRRRKEAAGWTGKRKKGKCEKKIGKEKGRNVCHAAGAENSQEDDAEVRVLLGRGTRAERR